MKLFLHSILALTVFTCHCQTAKTTLYVGTYTSSGKSEGIYKFNFDTKTGELQNNGLAAKIENPSFIAFSPNKKNMYAVGEGEASLVTSFLVGKEGLLKKLNTVSSNGKGPCHIATNRKGTKAVVSNYGGGTVSIYNINTDGSLSDAAQIFNHNTGNKPARAHSAQFHGNELYVADLGNNAIYQYELKDSAYQLKTPKIVEMEGNPGPRHFAVSKNSRFIYIINEYGSSITTVEKTLHGFKTIDSDSTLSSDFTGKNASADIHISQNERFLYGSNRGENSIAVFKRNKKDGTIKKIQTVSVQGDWPRNFTIDPSGRFLLVANQKSNTICVFSINPKTGKLTFKHKVYAPTPVCLLF